MRGLLKIYMKPEHECLMLGCGNSELSEQMYDAGYTKITNIDISSVVIKQMADRSRENRPEMSFVVGDVTDLHMYTDNTFDILIDKSTIDALLCGDESFLKTAKMLKEA